MKNIQTNNTVNNVVDKNTSNKGLPNYESHNYSKFKCFDLRDRELEIFTEKLNYALNKEDFEDLIINKLNQAHHDKCVLLKKLGEIKNMDRNKLYSLLKEMKNDIIRIIRLASKEFTKYEAEVQLVDRNCDATEEEIECAKILFKDNIRVAKSLGLLGERDHNWNLLNLKELLTQAIHLRITDISGFIEEIEECYLWNNDSLGLESQYSIEYTADLINIEIPYNPNR